MNTYGTIYMNQVLGNYFMFHNCLPNVYKITSKGGAPELTSNLTRIFPEYFMPIYIIIYFIWYPISSKAPVYHCRICPDLQ